jgi:hypothetical protein
MYFVLLTQGHWCLHGIPFLRNNIDVSVKFALKFMLCSEPTILNIGQYDW